MPKRLILSLVLLLGAGCAGSAPSPAPTVQNGAARSEDVSKLTATPPPAPPANETRMQTWTFPGTLPEQQIENRQIRITTPKGEIVFELFEKEAPKTVSNFVYLTKGGFYNGLTFHRYEPGFVIQGGDPNGNGTGGPGYRFEDETVVRAYDRGIVAMANAGPNTNGSQFFIMLADVPLPPNYTIFGKVTKGMDVVDQIRVGDAMTEVIVEAKSR